MSYRWTVVNVKSWNMDLRNRQPVQAVISDTKYFRLDYLLEFEEMCLKMGVRQGKREKQLSKDTAACIHHTCCGIVDLVKHLLIDEGYDYVCLEEFQVSSRLWWRIFYKRSTSL